MTDHEGWTSATDLISGVALPELFAGPQRRWGAAPHAAAALAWKSYTYWLTLPVVLSWAVSRRVPLVDPQHMLVRLDSDSPLLRIGFSRLQLAVAADDPIATRPEVAVIGDDNLLLKMMRVSLLDHHLEPLAERIQEAVKVGKHNLRGSIASGIAYGVLRAAKALPHLWVESGSAPKDARAMPSTPTGAMPSASATPSQTIMTVLEALGLEDLIELVPGAQGPEVRRKTCCLAFTLPEPKICSGCCLRTS
ncbi:MAG TPA: hypothetical protein VF062_02030 [Candidatus Limnocylindrales bacterium]